MRDMQMDKTELGCLRAIVLFNPGGKHYDVATRFAIRLQSQCLLALVSSKGMSNVPPHGMDCLKPKRIQRFFLTSSWYILMQTPPAAGLSGIGGDVTCDTHTWEP